MAKRAFATAAVLVLIAADALAAGSFPPIGDRVTTVGRTVLLSDRADGSHVIVEELELDVDASRIIYLQAFPAAPSVAPVNAELLSDLAEETTARAPRHDEVERLIFGPSILTAILAPLAKDATATVAPELVRLDLSKREIELFFGEVTSSTITGERFLPSDLESFLVREQIELPRQARSALLDYCDRGWTIAAAVIAEPGRRFTGRFAVGPTMFRYRGEETVYAMRLDPSAARLPLRLYTVGPAAMVPSYREITWYEKPWEPRDRVLGAAVTFSHPVTSELALTVNGLNAAAGDPAWLIRADVQGDGRQTLDLQVTAADEAKLVPGSYPRGGALDMFFCLLLGLTPIFYTPEALLLLWLRYNARARQQPREPLPPVAKLWGGYALIVALFWLIALDGSGRIAALGPLGVGLFQLLRPPERERGPVRVDFKRRKRPEPPKAEASGARAPGRTPSAVKPVPKPRGPTKS